MKLIPLSQGKFAKVDDEDFILFGASKWYASGNKKSFYVKREKIVGGKRISSILHREIMGVTDRRVKVDHKNHDTLDCRKSNLRLSTNSQNMMNRSGLAANNKSGVAGVFWHKRDKRWGASLMVAKKTIHLGSFIDKETAIKARLDGEKTYFGEFAPAAEGV